MAAVILLCSIHIWTLEAGSISSHAPDSILESEAREVQPQKDSDSMELPSLLPQAHRMSSTLVNEHALLQVQVSVVCTLSNEAKALFQDPFPHGSLHVEEELNMDTRWFILINELPHSSFDGDSSLHIHQAFLLNWSSYNDFRYKGNASLSFLIPLKDTMAFDERTVIVTLMEYSSDSHPRITTRRLANLPTSPLHSNRKNPRINPVVTIQLSGSTTCAYKNHVLNEGTHPQSSGITGWAIALVACILAYVFPKELPRYLPQDEHLHNDVASLSLVRLHLLEKQPMDNDDTIESNGQLSACSVEENESALRRDDSASSHVSTPDHGSGPRIEKPPQLVRIPCSFIFSEDEESVTCHNAGQNRLAFPRSVDAEPKPDNDVLVDAETDLRTANTPERAVNSCKTSIIEGKDMTKQKLDGDELDAHCIAKRRIHGGKIDLVANGIDSQKLSTITVEDKSKDKNLSKGEVGNRSVDDRQMTEVTVDAREPHKTFKVAVEDTSKCEKHQSDPDDSTVVNCQMNQRSGDVAVDVIGLHGTSMFLENSVGGRRSKVMDLEYLPVGEQTNWLQRLRERSAFTITSSTTIPSSSVAEEECQPLNLCPVETVAEMGFVTVDNDERDGASVGKASGGISYVSTLPADSDTTGSPINEWLQADPETAMDFSHAMDIELDSVPTRNNARPLKRKRRFEPFKSYRANDELLLSGSNRTHDMCHDKTGSRKQSSCHAATHNQEFEAVPTSQTVVRKSSRIKEPKRSKTPALLPDVVPSSFLQSFCTHQIDAPVPWDFTSSASLPISETGTRKRQRAIVKGRKGPPTTIEILDGPRSSQRAVSGDFSMASRVKLNGAHKSKNLATTGKRKRLP